MLELLACAGSPEAVTAAVQNGADAVYLSFDELSDCRKAESFADASFEASVRYCRVRGCKVYLALNTPVREDEMQKAGGLALRGQRAGVDAVIVRDLGLVSVLRSLMPDMPLFADKHLGFYTPEGAAAAADLGFKRIFLPPELPMEEIRRLADCGIETQVYAQTSLCVAASGTCRMSVMAGQGSEDRGLCGNPCREGFTFGGRMDTTPLSFKDRTLVPRIRELEEAGVTGVCLGDRDRRPEYVAAYTAVLRKAIREDQQPAALDRERMEQAFAPYGVAREQVYEPAETHETDRRVQERYLAEIQNSYTQGEERRVPVSFAVVAGGENKPVYLGAQDRDGHTATIEGPLADPLGDLDLTEEALSQAMYRTAGTPFRSEEVGTSLKEGLRVSGVELDAARRRLLYKLSEERAAAPKRKEGEFPAQPEDRDYFRFPVMNFAFQNAGQMTAGMAALKPECVYAPLELLAEHPEAADPFREAGSRVVAAMPQAACGEKELDQLREMLGKIRESGVEQVLVGNLGLARLAREEGLSLRGDLDLGVTNAYALKTLAEAGFESACFSPELSLRQVLQTPKPLRAELVIYGRLPVMVSEICLIKQSFGRCVCTNPGQMADTMGGVWPVTKHFGCRNTVWASRKLWLGDVVSQWAESNLWAVRLNFSTESPRECLEVANSYINGTGYRPNGMTRGAYLRGVL